MGHKVGENPAALRAAVFLLSSKNLRGGGAFKRPPPAGRGADSQSSRSCREVDAIPIQIHCAEVAITARSVKKYQLRKLHHVFE